MYRKKIVIFFITLAGLLLIVGCVDVNYIVEIDKDENVKARLIAEIDKNVAENKEQVEEFILDNFYKNLKSAGRYPFLNSYKLYETEEHYVFELSGPIGNIDTLHFGDFYGISSNPITFSGTGNICRPFYVSQSFTGYVSIPRNPSDGYLGLEHIKGQDIDIKITVKSSSLNLNNHNANEVLDHGRELVWFINPYELNEVTFGYVINNLYKLAIFFISLFIGFIWLRKLKKSRNMENK